MVPVDVYSDAYFIHREVKQIFDSKLKEEKVIYYHMTYESP